MRQFTKILETPVVQSAAWIFGLCTERPHTHLRTWEHYKIIPNPTLSLYNTDELHVKTTHALDMCLNNDTYCFLFIPTQRRCQNANLPALKRTDALRKQQLYHIHYPILNVFSTSALTAFQRVTDVRWCDSAALAQWVDRLSWFFSMDAKILGKQENVRVGWKCSTCKQHFQIWIRVYVEPISHPLTAHFRLLICSVWCDDDRERGERAHERLTHAKAGYYLCCCSGQGSVWVWEGELGEGGTDEGRLSSGVWGSGFPVGRVIKIRQAAE